MPRRLRPIIPCLLSLVALAPGIASAAEGEPLLVIVHPHNTVADISADTLAAIYRGEDTHWPSGERIVAINLPQGSKERTLFDKTILRMDPEEAKRYWVDRKMRGTAASAKEIASVLLLQRVVAKMAGAIAYVRQSQLQGSVKPLTINEIGPGDPAYPLKP